jgi:hypothetical protein
MATNNEVAEWMRERLLAQDILYQEDAVHHIRKDFGKELVYTNQEGGLSIDRRVLRAFRGLTEGTAVWERSDKCWRKRQPYEPPGRRQVD